MGYTSFFTDEFSQEFKRLDRSVQEVSKKHIRKIIEMPLRKNHLHGESNLFKERFLQYRIIYKVDGLEIKFLRIGKRDSVYG